MNDVTDQQDTTALTMEAIDEDWWHAIYRPLPGAATGSATTVPASSDQ